MQKLPLLFCSPCLRGQAWACMPRAPTRKQPSLQATSPQCQREVVHDHSEMRGSCFFCLCRCFSVNPSRQAACGTAVADGAALALGQQGLSTGGVGLGSFGNRLGHAHSRGVGQQVPDYACEEDADSDEYEGGDDHNIEGSKEVGGAVREDKAWKQDGVPLSPSNLPGLGNQAREVPPFVLLSHKGNTVGYGKQHCQYRPDLEMNEVAHVDTSYTVAYERAVMVHVYDTPPTCAAVVHPWWFMVLAL
mmetsp:Transcript_22501/g.62124  ORF Transcript_22501/g.62124 Transcript_22501/m.62124 type:complete len:247 (+) Transcript_22501:91-831(+)